MKIYQPVNLYHPLQHTNYERHYRYTRTEISRIQYELSSRSRQVEKGCMIKVPIAKPFESILEDKITASIYSIVGNEYDNCRITTAHS